MKYPEQVYINPIKYKIIYTESNTDRLGYCDFNNATISLLIEQPDTKILQTLIHEIVHAICEEAQINISDHATDRLANVLIRFIRDNKEIIKIIGGTK